MKRFLSLLLAVALVLACAPLTPLQVYADTSDGYTYTIKNGEATITDFDTSISGELIIPDTLGGYPVTAIGNYAFYSCYLLTDITIPNTVTSIGGYAFYSCHGANRITISASVTTIGEYAFFGCRGLTGITIPAGVTSIGDSAFQNCTYLAGIWVEENNLYYSSDEYGVLFNKDQTTLITVPNGLTGSYKMPDTVTEISVGAVSNSHLREVIVGSNVTTIPRGVFTSSNGLQTVTIPDGVTSIGEGTFMGCYELAVVNIPATLTSISSYVFSDCGRLNTVNYSGTLAQRNNIYIGSANAPLYAAKWVYNAGGEESEQVTLTDLKLTPPTKREYDQYEPLDLADMMLTATYSDGSVLEIFEIYSYFGYNSSVLGEQTITVCYEGRTFEFTVTVGANTKCGDNLTWELVDGVLTISGTGSMTEFNWAAAPWYSERGQITKIVINDGATTICPYAFYDCYNLKEVILPDSITDIGGQAFNACHALTDITLPKTSVSLGYAAFVFCSSLEKAVVPDGVTIINCETFSGCSSLKEVTIPSSVTYVDLYAFYNCSALTTVYYLGTEAQKVQMTIAADNDPLRNATWIYVEPPVCEYVDADTQSATQFKTLEEALAVATKGTIKLLADVTVGDVLLKSDVILDLNGYTLTADLFVALNGATVLDGGTPCKGGGKLKIEKDNLIFASNNRQGVVPVWNGTDGYLFTAVSFQHLARTAGEGAAQYIFLPTFSNKEAEALLADGGMDNGLKIQVCLTWNNGQSQQYYTYSDDLVMQVYDGTGSLAFDLTVTGIANIEDIVAQAVAITEVGPWATTTTKALTAG